MGAHEPLLNDRVVHPQVGSNLNGAATHRKIGKAVSEKVYIVLFTSNKNLDLSSDIRKVRAAAAS